MIVIAPEGGIHSPAHWKRAAAARRFLAYKSGAPILPIAITGTENEKTCMGR
jgi:1-acyl-sn-glycerol-3-phosphate acyltransferase